MVVYLVRFSLTFRGPPLAFCRHPFHPKQLSSESVVTTNDPAIAGVRWPTNQIGWPPAKAGEASSWIRPYSAPSDSAFRVRKPICPGKRTPTCGCSSNTDSLVAETWNRSDSWRALGGEAGTRPQALRQGDYVLASRRSEPWACTHSLTNSGERVAHPSALGGDSVRWLFLSIGKSDRRVSITRVLAHRTSRDTGRVSQRPWRSETSSHD